jgi:hypothetical protein
MDQLYESKFQIGIIWAIRLAKKIKQQFSFFPQMDTAIEDSNAVISNDRSCNFWKKWLYSSVAASNRQSLSRMATL